MNVTIAQKWLNTFLDVICATSLVTVGNGLSGLQYLLGRLGVHVEAERVVRPEEKLELLFQDGDVPVQDNGESKVGDAAGIAPVPDLALELFITSLVLGNHILRRHLARVQVVSYIG